MRPPDLNTPALRAAGQPPASLTERTVAAASQVLAGESRGWRTALAFAGPAVIASIAYMDPGNFATNIQAGAKYGYALLWVVLVANIIAMLFQALSAKLGIVTGRTSPKCAAIIFRGRWSGACGLVSEIAAMATDLAEFLGGAIGLSLLFHMPLLAGMVVTAIVTYALLMLRAIRLPSARAHHRRHRRHHLPLLCRRDVHRAGGLGRPRPFILVVPQIADRAALLLAVGIIGATVMPHAIYLHSGLTQARMPLRDDDERRTVLRFSNREVVIALAVAGPGQHGHGDDGLGRVPCRPSGSGARSRPPITR